MDTDCIIVYASVHHGNTRLVAEAMGEAIDAPAIEVGPGALDAVDGVRLVGLGSGAFFGSHHKSLLSFASQLPSDTCLSAFIFSTSGTGWRLAKLFGRDYHKRLRRILQDKGIPVLGEFDCKGFDTYGLWGRFGGVAKGHPTEEELQGARAFARDVYKRNKSGEVSRQGC
ncbi:MAG: flavodoxin [Chloroflexota bacterium]